MIEIIYTLLVFILGYMVGEMIFIYRLRNLLHKVGFNEHIAELEQKKPAVAKLFIEQEKETYYLYDYDANKFICQANTIDELASLAQKYNNIHYAAVLHGDDMLMFVNGVVTNKT